MASRTKHLALAFALAALMAIGAQSAGAQITAVPYGGTTDVAPGAHGDLTTGVTFDYGDDSSETIRRILIDTPAGGLGNPNAVPYADRCTRETFETSTCDPASQIGEVTISAIAWLTPLTPVPLENMKGTISQLQTDPEIPTEVGAYITPPLGDPIRAYARFYPVTKGPDGDFRIRSETDPFPTEAHIGELAIPIQITKYEQLLYGRVAGGTPFITNPTRCDSWDSWGYAEFYNSNDLANSDPLGSGTNTFYKTDVIPTAPDCTNLAPFQIGADAQLGSAERGSHTALGVDLSIPGLAGDPVGAATPKTIVTTLPKGVTIDVAQLGRVCSEADFAAYRCPASSQVGSVRISTPMIAAGLTGEAYLLDGAGLPDLGLHVHGAIEFNLRGTNRFVNINQVQTTFDNLPQVGYSAFRLDIFGGNNGLLLVNQCPSGGQADYGGRVNFAITSYQGQAINANSSAEYRLGPCYTYRVKVKRPKRCVTRRGFRFTPTISPRSQVRHVRYYVRGKYVKKVKKRPWRAHIRINRKLKKGKRYSITARVYFKPSDGRPKGHVVSRTTHFRICR